MANQKISDLTAKATPVGADTTVIIDSAAPTTNKKITLDTLPISTPVQTALNAKRSFNLTSVGDANYTVLSTDFVVVTSVAFTASRTWTLPAANSIPAGSEIIIADLIGTVTTTNTLVIQRAGADTINGVTSATIGQAYGMRRLVSNGSNAWIFDGGVARLSGGNVFSGTQDLGNGILTNASANIQTITSFPYTLLASDNGKVLRLNSASAAVVNLPDSLPVGWSIAWSQAGAGQITFTPTGGATMNNRQSHTKSAGQHGMGSLVVMTNSGSNAMYNLAGDTGA